jgi:hypothetical protein
VGKVWAWVDASDECQEGDARGARMRKEEEEEEGEEGGESKMEN